MDERDYIKAIVNRIMISEFLITPISLIFRRAQDRDLKPGRSLPMQPLPECVVLRCVVNN